MITWRKAVKDLSFYSPENMQVAATKFAKQLSEDQRIEIVAQALMREARNKHRDRTHSSELRAANRTTADVHRQLPEVTAEVRRRLGPVLQSWREQMRLEWSDELLRSSFSLRDGTRVMWGDATVAQHKERVDIFMELSAANLDGAAKHVKAIQAIEAASAECLNDVVAIEAIPA